MEVLPIAFGTLRARGDIHIDISHCHLIQPKECHSIFTHPSPFQKKDIVTSTCNGQQHEYSRHDKQRMRAHSTDVCRCCRDRVDFHCWHSAAADPTAPWAEGATCAGCAEERIRRVVDHSVTSQTKRKRCSSGFTVDFNVRGFGPFSCLEMDEIGLEHTTRGQTHLEGREQGSQVQGCRIHAM